VHSGVSEKQTVRHAETWAKLYFGPIPKPDIHGPHPLRHANLLDGRA
jgi:hypothetical protein